MSSRPERLLILCVSSASGNKQRRRAIRRSWFTFKTSLNPWLTPEQQQSVELCFVVSRAGSSDVAAEQEEHGDMLLLDAPEGYENLWRKALASLQHLEQRFRYAYYMHADDDSYVRLDLVLQLLSESPSSRFYWGYVWDGTGNRCTAPIRNPRNKSHMPREQYALDFYPPFASGCGFVLSHDLVAALLKQPLPDYRLLDPPFGIHLCGGDFCVLPDGPVQPVHDERVRPYRGLPIFQAATIVQHYLAPEEMAPYHQQVLEYLIRGSSGSSGVQHDPGGGSSAPSGSSSDGQRRGDAPAPAAGDGDRLAGGAQGSNGASGSSAGPAASPSDGLTASDELYKQLVSLGLLRR